MLFPSCFSRQQPQGAASLLRRHHRRPGRLNRRQRRCRSRLLRRQLAAQQHRRVPGTNCIKIVLPGNSIFRLYTLRRPVMGEVLSTRILGVPPAGGRYCSYLLPKQAGGTPQILVDKTTSFMTGRLRVYLQENRTSRRPFL